MRRFRIPASGLVPAPAAVKRAHCPCCKLGKNRLKHRPALPSRMMLFEDAQLSAPIQWI